MSETGNAAAAAKSGHTPPGESAAGIVVLIPAYRPGPVLVDIVKELSAGDWDAIE